MAIRKSYRKQILARLKTRREKALFLVGVQAVGFVKPQVPVDSGFLRSSITFATSTEQSKPTREAGKGGGSITAPISVVPEKPGEGHLVIGTNVHYAPHIEYGTVKRKRKSFLRLGILNHRKELAQTYAKIMRGFNKIGKGR